MQENPMVTAADIARLAGVGRAAVSNWRKRHPDFPAPVGGTSASPEFDLGQVEAWLRDQGKLPELSIEDQLWRELLMAGEQPADTLAVVGAHLLAARGEPAAGEPPAADRSTRLLAAVDELVRDRGPQRAFDELRNRLEQSASPGLPRATPDTLADLMVALAKVEGGSLLDPACGTGGVLRAAVRAGCATAYGQEIDEVAGRLAGLWLALNGAPGEVRYGDTMRADAFVGLTVDAVVCHPPFGATNWGQEELAYDPRWEYAPPLPRTEPELAWVQHSLHHLRPGGRAVVLMPPAAASRRAGRRIRTELLRKGALRGVVALPARAGTSHGVPLHLWVLDRPAPDAPLPAQVLLVDIAATAETELPAAGARVVRAFEAFAAAPNAPVDEAGFARAVPVIELLDEEVDLTPARRHPSADPQQTGEHLIQTRERLAAVVTELPRLMREVCTGTVSQSTPHTVSVAELARSGALQILGPIRAVADSAVTDSAAPEPTGPDQRRPVLTVQDVLLGQEASGRTEDRLGQEIVLAPGDVVVPMVARQLAARVVDSVDRPLLGRNLYLLRPNPAALDCWFLAGQLRTSTNEKQTSSLSGTLRFDIRRAQVRRLPLDEQRAHGAAVRRLDAFESAIRQAAALGAELVQLTADGLARGMLRTDGEAR